MSTFILFRIDKRDKRKQVPLILTLGAFVSKMTEYLPIGLLPQISSDLQVSLGATGWLVTGQAWIITLTASLMQ